MAINANRARHGQDSLDLVQRGPHGLLVGALPSRQRSWQPAAPCRRAEYPRASGRWIRNPPAAPRWMYVRFSAPQPKVSLPP